MRALTRGTHAAVLLGGWMAGSTMAVPDPQQPTLQQEQQEKAADAAARILKKADAATKAVKMVSYHVTWEGTDWLKPRTWTLEGDVITRKSVGDAPPVFLYTLTKAQAPESSEITRFTAGSDGLSFFLIDYETKKVHEDVDPAVLGRGGRLARSLGMVEFTHATPFTDEITGDKSLLMGTETVGGEECYKVYVLYKGGRQEAEWYFSKKDYLPRRVDRIAENSEGVKARRVRTVTNLVVDPQISEEKFRSEVPEGFTKTDEFAPDPRLPM